MLCDMTKLHVNNYTTFFWIFGIFYFICFGSPFNGPEYQEIYGKNFKTSQNFKIYHMFLVQLN